MSTASLPVNRPAHGHHKVAAAIFVGTLILGAAMILSAELIKPERYEFHSGNSSTNYVIFDRETGRAVMADFNSKDPLASLKQ
jgi:hypothetical protein